MSKTLNAAAIASFDAMLKHKYQDAGKLRPCVTVRTGITGSTHRFPNIGSGMATERSTQTDVTPMNLAHGNRTATLTFWNAAEYTDIFDESATNVNEREALSGAIAKAITRREDQLLINAMEAASTTHTVATSVGGAGSDLNVVKLRRINRILGDNGVEMDGSMEKVTFVGSHYGKDAMLGETEVTSADYNTVRALVNGEVNSFLGMDYKWIATRGEGGLDVTSNVRTNFAFAATAMGLAVGLDFRTEINYIPHKTSWLANGIFSGGAVDIDADGLVEISTTEP